MQIWKKMGSKVPLCCAYHYTHNVYKVPYASIFHTPFVPAHTKSKVIWPQIVPSLIDYILICTYNWKYISSTYVLQSKNVKAIYNSYFVAAGWQIGLATLFTIQPSVHCCWIKSESTLNFLIQKIYLFQ